MKTTADGQVSVRQIAKTFASGKSAEKVVYSTLADCDLPCGKVRKWFAGIKHQIYNLIHKEITFM